MRRLIVPLLLLACIPCDRSGIVEYGEPAVGSELVLAAAAARCDLDGLVVRWVEDGHGYADLVVPSACGTWLDVERRDPAWTSAEAHGLAHICLGLGSSAEDEAAADAWAAEVNAEARGEG